MPPASGSHLRGRPAPPGDRSTLLAPSRSTPMGHSVSPHAALFDKRATGLSRLADIAPQSQAQRYRQISRGLARHGLGFFISGVGLELFVPFQRIFNRNYEQPLSRPEQFRRAVVEIRPKFINLDHIVSTR